MRQPAKRSAQHCSHSKLQQLQGGCASRHNTPSGVAVNVAVFNEWIKHRQGWATQTAFSCMGAPNEVVGGAPCKSSKHNLNWQRPWPLTQRATTHPAKMSFLRSTLAAGSLPALSCSRRAVLPHWQVRWAKRSGSGSGSGSGFATHSAQRIPLAVVARRGGEEGWDLFSMLQTAKYRMPCWHKLPCFCRASRYTARQAELKCFSAAVGQGVCAAGPGPARRRFLCGPTCGGRGGDGPGPRRRNSFRR